MNGPWLRRSANLALAGAVMLAAAGARAQTDPCEPPDGLSTCVPADNLWPQVGGGSFVAQAPTRTAAEGSAAFGLALGYIYRPIGLRVASADPEGTTIYAVEHALGATLLTAIGVTDALHVQLAAPFVLYQDGATTSDVVGSDDFLPRSAVGDLRFGATLSILSRAAGQDGAGLAARFEMSAPSGQDEAFVGGPTAAYAPGMSFDYRIGRVLVGIDAGARIREETAIAGTVIASQISGALGVGVDILEDGWLSVQAEAWALFGLVRGTLPGTEDEPRPLHIPAEWLVSLRTAGALEGRLGANLGAGSFIPTGDDLPVTTPAFRLAAGIHYLHDFAGSR